MHYHVHTSMHVCTCLYIYTKRIHSSVDLNTTGLRYMGNKKKKSRKVFIEDITTRFSIEHVFSWRLL